MTERGSSCLLFNKRFIHVPATWEDGDPCPRPHRNISLQAEVFTKEGEGREAEQRDPGWGRDLQSSLPAEEHSAF